MCDVGFKTGKVIDMSKKSAFIALLGRANVGKSSLLNSIIGTKVAIVSDKPQTTRTRIMGVLNEGENQYVFIDTPGFHKPKNLLDDRMNKAVYSGIADVDAVVLVVDAVPEFKFDFESLPKAEEELLKNIFSRKIPCVLVINKIDLLKEKKQLLHIIEAYTNKYSFNAVVPLSAKTGDGVGILKTEIAQFLKISPHYFSDDDYTDQPDKAFVCEIIREKLLMLLSKEVPHGIAVDVERFFESDNKIGDPVVNIEAVIYCERDSHKGIIIGKGGTMLKRAGMLARYDLEKFFGTKISLKLWVKVKEDWRNRAAIIKSLGLDNLS
ncbi:MAG: GTPase Era [Clostridia bacterium]|nr:GTPase Era [Clostridia bacterium]